MGTDFQCHQLTVPSTIRVRASGGSSPDRPKPCSRLHSALGQTVNRHSSLFGSSRVKRSSARPLTVTVLPWSSKTETGPNDSSQVRTSPATHTPLGVQ